MRGYKHLAAIALTGWLAAVLLHAWSSNSLELRLYAADTREALDTLDRSNAPCRVLIVGSSPAVFGISAATINERTGCAVANLGLLDVGALLDNYLRTIIERVRPGDVVLLTDRRWTEQDLKLRICESNDDWRCYVWNLHLAPNFAERIRFLNGLNLMRDARGDLTEFPPMTVRLVRVASKPIGDIEDRLSLIARQSAEIRARGGCPVFAPVPIQIEPASRSALEDTYAKLGQSVSMTVGPGVWQQPLLETDSSLFVLEGQHTSESGRKRWTTSLLSALSKHCVAPPLQS
jgi:hypothetical protein